MILLVLFLLLFEATAYAATYGEANESCTTSGTVLTATDKWQDALQAATPGTYLLRNTNGSTFTTGGTLIINEGTSEANRVIVKPYNCQAINVRGSVQIGSYVTFGGFDHRHTGGWTVIIRPKTLNGTVWAEAPIYRNNTSHQLATNTANAHTVRISGDVRNHQITGNFLTSANGANGATTVYQQNNLGTNARDPVDIYFANNKCSNSGGEGCFQVGRNTSPGNLKGAMNGVNNLIYQNWFTAIVSEQGIDLKGMSTSNTLVSIVENTFDTHSFGACLLIHQGTPSNSQVLVERNFFNNCNTSRSINLGGKYEIGDTNEANWRVIVRRNVIKHTGVTAEAIFDQLTGTVIERNTILNGQLEFDEDIPSATSTFRDNQISGTNINDGRSSGEITCSNNALHSTTGSFVSTCSNGRTDDPQFVNTTTNDFNSAQTTHVNAGTTNAPFNGSARDLGALEAPVLSACSVETAAPTVIVCDWTNNIAPPLSAATNASFTARVAGVARTINTTTVQNTNQTHHTLASAVTVGQAVDITCTTIGCVQDSANIGGPELALNAKAKTFSQFSVTNNVDAAPAAWEVAQVAYRVTRENNIIAINTPMSVPPGTAILVEFQTNCTGDDCPPFAQKMRYTLDGGASTALSNTMTADNLRFFGNTEQSPYIPAEGTHTAGCLVDTAGVDVAGSVQRTSAAVPNLDLAINDCTVNAYAIIFDTDAVVGSTYAFCPANQDGTALNGGCDEPATIFISEFPGVPADGRVQATGRTAATGRTQATGRVQVIQ